MDRNSCPVTSTISNPVESPKPPLLSCGNASSPKVERESPEPNCAICLGKTENKSFTDSCLHQFCFNCLLEWSKVKAECPLCKQSFKSIIHNVRSNEEYEEYYVEASRETRYWQEETSVVRFRYSTTLTPERQRERFLESIVGPLFFGTDAIPARRERRRYRNSTGDFRASIYRDNLWADPLPDVTGRYRECSPEFYRLNPAQLHRLVPWLNRELNVLHVPSTHLVVVIDLILSLLPQYAITSVEFQSRISPHIGVNTEHFVHEFYAFARSPYDMIGFDQTADYHPGPTHFVTEVQAIDSGSDSDSDIVVISHTPNNNPAATLAPRASTSGSSQTNTQRQPVNEPLNLSANPSCPVRVSPVAGPSSLDDDLFLMITRELQNPTSFDRFNTIRIPTPPPVRYPESHPETVESDSDDCVIVGYVKPRHERTPEVITLASDQESGRAQATRRFNSMEERTKYLFSSSTTSPSTDDSDDDYVSHQSRRLQKATPKSTRKKVLLHKKVSLRKKTPVCKKARTHVSLSSDDSESPAMTKTRVYSSDSESSIEDVRHKKSKEKGKHKRTTVLANDSSDDTRSVKSSRTKKAPKEVWRIVRKQEPETDHDYSLDCYDPPYTEDEWTSLSTDRPKLRSIVISKSAGSSRQREASQSSTSRASSSRSSSHFHESKHHRHKSHKKREMKQKERHCSESSSPVRSCKDHKKKPRCKRSHHNLDSSS